MRELLLLQTPDSGPLVPSRFVAALAVRDRLGETPRATMVGQELRGAVVLPLEHAASAAFLLDFVGQGLRVKGSARGPSADLLTWGFHALAAALHCGLRDVEHGDRVPEPAAHRAAALAYLAAYEAEVCAYRPPANDDDEGGVFLAWLEREDQLALAMAAADVGRGLPMEDGRAMYEQILEHEGVEDVFLSERELAQWLARFRARRTLPRALRTER